MTTNLLSQIRPRVHYTRVPRGVGSAYICRELVKRFQLSELKCVQDYGLGKFEVTFANDEASRRFSDDPVLAIRDAKMRFQYRGVRVKVVRVIGFPADADVRIIAQLLARYGNVLDCKARTTSSATPSVASSSSREQVSGAAEDREAAPGDAEGSTQPQPEPNSERAAGGEEQEVGSELAEALALSAAAEPSPASPAGAPGTSPADAPAAGEKEETHELVGHCSGQESARQLITRALQGEAGGGSERRPRQPSGRPSGSEASRSDRVRRGVHLVDCHGQYHG
ncbi:hypothetical protein MRX96_037599 [Rhipicephalus microplus]